MRISLTELREILATDTEVVSLRQQVRQMLTERVVAEAAIAELAKRLKDNRARIIAALVPDPNPND